MTLAMTEWLRSSRNRRRERLAWVRCLPGLAVVGLHSDGVATGGMMPEDTGTEVVVHGFPLNHRTRIDVSQIYMRATVRPRKALKMSFSRNFGLFRRVG